MSPKTEGRGPTIAQVLAPYIARYPGKGVEQAWGAKLITQTLGALRPSQLSAAAIEILNVAIARIENANTKYGRACQVRRHLETLREDYGAPSLAKKIIRPATPRPRNITATADERARLLDALPANVKCWVLLCSDMAIRSGTAARLTPNNYDQQKETLTFSTKYDEKQTLPVTSELAALLGARGLRSDVPYVAQLPRGRSINGKQLRPLGRLTVAHLRNVLLAKRKQAGITRKLTAHDLRRTTAVAVYGQTKDLRVAQAVLGHASLTSTLWYLDHHLTPVNVETLELAKLNPKTEIVQ